MGSILHTLVRRWPVTILGILLTGALCFVAYVAVPVRYQATANVLLVPPKSGPGDNPLLDLTGMDNVADVLARAATDTKATEQVARAGLIGSFGVARDITTGGPVLLITTTSPTAQQALDLRAQVIGVLDPTLASLQTSMDVSISSRITTNVLNASNTATVVAKSQTRALIAAGAVGLLLTLQLVALVERLSLRRARRRAADADAAAAPVADAERDPDQSSPVLEQRSGLRKEVARAGSKDRDAQLAAATRRRDVTRAGAAQALPEPQKA